MANMKGFGVVYSEEEYHTSVYSAWSEEDSSEESESNTEEDCNPREVYLLELKNWEENTTKEIVSSYSIKPGTFTYTGSGFSLAKKFAIPEEYWTIDPRRSAVGRTIKGGHILMDTIAKKVKITIGGGDFIIEELWQSENQDADILLGNEFILQQTFIQKTLLNLIGNKNYLLDALTRELAMFNRSEGSDEGRNPRNRRPGKKPEQPEEIERVLKSFLLCPKRPVTTDQSQGKGLASLSQTVDGKSLTRPLMATALPKSRLTPKGVLNVHGY
ncbi:hypothetical protein ACLB2K_058698 [Fragaria x ananassa]